MPASAFIPLLITAAARGAQPALTRRAAVQTSVLAGSWLPWPSRASAAAPRRTNEVVSESGGMRLRRLGGTDIAVSEMGLGTQRWGSTDFNAPDEALCHAMLDRAVDAGVNLVDTAEQYPIPSDDREGKPEGLTEEIIGRWAAKGKGRREKLVLASKITGGANVTPKNIVRDLDGSLRRLQTNYLDVYLLHWPARYTPQSNWGQSLMYHRDMEGMPWYQNGASFEELARTMGGLVQQGKIRAYGMCNDNAVGLCLTAAAARQLGVPGPSVMENDFSLLDRRAEENGVSEASSPRHLNAGFFAYNVLAGGMLTGKYLDEPAAVDNANEAEARRRLGSPRGRMDEYGWGRTLYRYRSGPAGAATREYARIAKRAGMPLAELALRWSRDRDLVTSSLVGCTSPEQLEQNLGAFGASGKGRRGLPVDVLWEIDRVHMRNRLPIFASERVGKDWDGEGEIGERIP